MTKGMSLKTFGRRFDPSAFAFLMERKYLSLEGFADDMPAHQKRVRAWLDGTITPSIQSLRRACELLDCTINAVAPKLPLSETAPIKAPRLTDKRPSAGRILYFQRGRA